MPKSIDPNESVAIIESHGLMAAARLVQLIGQETRARVVAVGPVNPSGSVTTIIAGPLAEVQHALEAARSRNAMTDSAFFARPNLDTMEMLIGSTLGEPVRIPAIHRKHREEPSLTLFNESMDSTAQKPRSVTSSEPRNVAPAPTGRKAQPRKRRTTSEVYVRRPLIEIEQMPVHALRRYARTIPDLPITGREISRANRGELMQMIKSQLERIDTIGAHGTMARTMMPS